MNTNDNMASTTPEVSVVMPCLNEEKTVGICITKTQAIFEQLACTYEIIVADNGSTDNSTSIAARMGARVIHAPKRGYGHAYIAGISASSGQYIVMGDADDSYDFGEIPRFLEKLRHGADLVMGSRFRGEIKTGAMPWLHRYFGNPVLSRLLNLLFKAGVTDAHCGLRALTKETWTRLQLRTGGMEFASEMVIRAAQEQLSIREVPVTLHPDGRDRPPHLRSFRDGWRHLRFMLLYSPNWLFWVPALFPAIIGALLVGLLPFVHINLFHHRFSYHFSLLGSTFLLVSFQLVQLGFFAKVIFVGAGLGENAWGRWGLERARIGRLLLMSGSLISIGLGANIKVLLDWITNDFGAVDRYTTSLVVLASTLLLLGVHLLFGTFFLGVLRGSRTGRWSD
ncbi:MAG: glycosyltransferase family 2 protein [Myxococcales bacterium]|nr:glycosyltransferase family 2 protein [Myxococcales bacterium]